MKKRNNEIEKEIANIGNEVGTLEHLAVHSGLINDDTKIVIDNGFGRFSGNWFQDFVLEYMELHYEKFTYDPTENKIELTYNELPEC